MIQPGYSVSELAVMPAAMAFLSDPTLKIFVHGNDPAFVPSLDLQLQARRAGAGTAFHAVIPQQKSPGRSRRCASARAICPRTPAG